MGAAAEGLSKSWYMSPELVYFDFPSEWVACGAAEKQKQTNKHARVNDMQVGQK
jgi:hypothetical protein